MKKTTPKYDSGSKDRARYARNLADLLWRKACQTMTQEQQELLRQCISICEMAVAVVPEVEPVVYSFEDIARMAEEAETLLLTCPHPQSGLKWEEFQVLLKKESETASV